MAVAGSDRDHDASAALTFIGSAIGSAGGWYVAAEMREENALGGTIILGACAGLGGTLMHRLTRTRRRTSTASALRVVPLGGSAVGLSVVGTMW